LRAAGTEGQAKLKCKIGHDFLRIAIVDVLAAAAAYKNVSHEVEWWMQIRAAWN